MGNSDQSAAGKCLHVVTLGCKDAAHASQCLQALAAYGRPDALAYGAESYEFGLSPGQADRITLVERWKTFADLDKLLVEKVVPALPVYNALLARPFDPASDTLRIQLAD